MKHYKGIKHFKEDITESFQPGDLVVIQEKIDGSNLSFTYDTEQKCILTMSRRDVLDEINNMRGAYQYINEIVDADLAIQVLGTDLVIFGEWLTKHTINYPENCYRKAYFYDVFDKVNDIYLTQDKVLEITNKLELISVPTFYTGPFISWEHVYSFIGRTDLGGDIGEGIVIKNMSRIRPEAFSHSKSPYYVKIVTSEFRETKAHKNREVDLDQVAKIEQDIEITKSIVTKARVRKMIHNLVDEHIIPEDWSKADMRTIAQHLGSRIYADCIKEEPEIVSEIGDSFGRYASRESMNLAKDVLSERNQVE